MEHLLAISGMNVKIDILVNKSSAFSENLSGSVSIPITRITHFMKEGENTIDITVNTIPDQYNNHSCKIRFGHVNLDESKAIIYDDEKLIQCGDELTDKGTEHFSQIITAHNLVAQSATK